MSRLTAQMKTRQWGGQCQLASQRLKPPGGLRGGAEGRACSSQCWLCTQGPPVNLPSRPVSPPKRCPPNCASTVRPAALGIGLQQLWAGHSDQLRTTPRATWPCPRPADHTLSSNTPDDFTSEQPQNRQRLSRQNLCFWLLWLPFPSLFPQTPPPISLLSHEVWGGGQGGGGQGGGGQGAGAQPQHTERPGSHQDTLVPSFPGRGAFCFKDKLKLTQRVEGWRENTPEQRLTGL